MSTQQLRRYGARAAILFLALYLSIGAFSQHGDYLKLIGGIAMAYVFAWLGGEIERNREQP